MSDRLCEKGQERAGACCTRTGPIGLQSRYRAAGTGGFTLMEIIITLVILSIAAVGVLSVFSTALKGGVDPLLIDQAAYLAQGEMDQVLGEKAASGFGTIAVGNPLACVSSMLAGYTCSRSIFYVNPADLNTQVAGPTPYKHVTVTITQATVGSLSVDTVIADY